MCWWVPSCKVGFNQRYFRAISKKTLTPTYVSPHLASGVCSWWGFSVWVSQGREGERRAQAVRAKNKHTRINQNRLQLVGRLTYSSEVSMWAHVTEELHWADDLFSVFMYFIVGGRAVTDHHASQKRDSLFIYRFCLPFSERAQYFHQVAHWG